MKLNVSSKPLQGLFGSLCRVRGRGGGWLQEVAWRSATDPAVPPDLSVAEL